MGDMAESYLSGKQEKIDRFQQIKKKVDGMIKTHVSFLKCKADQDGSADDFQDNGNNERKGQGKYAMNNALEDKICELYGLYAERMDNDKDFQPKKAHAELAELWPKDYVDGNAIKNAISRSKARKRARLLRNKGKKPTSAKETNTGGITQQQPMQQKTTTNTTQSAANNYISHQASKLDEKTQISSSTSKMKTAAEEVKNKVKRKSETDLNEIHPHPAKLSIRPPVKRSDVNEVHRFSQNKIYGSTDSIPPPKPNVQLPSLSVV